LFFPWTCPLSLSCSLFKYVFPGYNGWRQTTRTGNWLYKDVSKRHVSFTLKYWSILALSLEVILQAQSLHSCTSPHSVFECPSIFAPNGFKWLVCTFFLSPNYAYPCVMNIKDLILAFLNIASDIILSNTSSVGNALIIFVEGPSTKELALTICTI